MKIVKAEVFVTCPGRNFVTLKITTEDGITGLGDATLNGRELSVASYLQDHLCPQLIGRDAHRIEDIWQFFYKGAYWRRGPVTMSAISAVDMALWDIKAKAANMPLYQLLGGGVTGDLTGFVAATYLRGIDFVQIPTTLLAQVDSSIGGKTGVDFDSYKNMVGAFKMPRLVYMNLSVLKTLEERQFYSGFAEVMKSALIKDALFYEWLIENMYEICEREPATLEEMVIRTCSIKKMVVEKDPTEQGDRALLNLGHTIGHAIEKAKNFELYHGECVALGTVAAAYISWKKEMLSMEEFYEIRDMFVPFYLPISVDDIDPQEILKLTKSDKKMEAGKIKFILLKKIGKAVIDRTVTDDEILAAIEEINFSEEDAHE